MASVQAGARHLEGAGGPAGIALLGNAALAVMKAVAAAVTGSASMLAETFLGLRGLDHAVHPRRPALAAHRHGAGAVRRRAAAEGGMTHAQQAAGHRTCRPAALAPLAP
jgi:hypothetical protein